MQMLLERGADPNLKVYSDSADRNSQLRPVLVEYLASNDKPSVHIVNLLLRYGARVCACIYYQYHQVTFHCYVYICNTYLLQVVMKTQFRDPDGVLNSLQNLPHPVTDDDDDDDVDDDDERNGALFFLLLQATESFDRCMIKRCMSLTARQRSALLQLSARPLPLRRLVRLHMHRWLPGQLPTVVHQLELPVTLRTYLLYDYS